MSAACNSSVAKLRNRADTLERERIQITLALERAQIKASVIREGIEKQPCASDLAADAQFNKLIMVEELQMKFQKRIHRNIAASEEVQEELACLLDLSRDDGIEEVRGRSSLAEQRHQ
ncbi:hypothetical protein CAPTEDRAFT_197563 [Capitella teleta]|uniref:REM-1 domain-containing protein n=1 Tax=Capitella teleta TaxID=283909 RepID=R7TWC1_CAPTE|nr:hypothetical protein CAPTEDRAFT_197563 [Capitella teleta]|eukprot:ELT98039.1 hypothetical protein CAPTEDRAFT_197563 [Capitella teleta]